MLQLAPMFAIYEQREADRKQKREVLRGHVRQELKEALHQVVPGHQVYVFGSLVHPHKFHDRSDVDIAFVSEPVPGSEYRLKARLEELLHRPVDVLLLDETRFKDKIVREGELWTS